MVRTYLYHPKGEAAMRKAIMATGRPFFFQVLNELADEDGGMYAVVESHSAHARDVFASHADPDLVLLPPQRSLTPLSDEHLAHLSKSKVFKIQKGDTMRDALMKINDSFPVPNARWHPDV